jgi:hypothetical protein
MVKPYRYTRQARLIGLPLGFGLLGLSYLFAGFSFYSNIPAYVQQLSWLQLITQAYAFAFLVVTYLFTEERFEAKSLSWLLPAYAGLIVGIIASILFLLIMPIFGLPSYTLAEESFLGANIVLLLYLFAHTLRGHASSTDGKTLWVPIGYLLLAFSQYSTLISSLDSSPTALIGSYAIRLAGLMMFLSVSYQAFVASPHDS